LLLLHIRLVVQGGFRRHVLGWHTAVGGHAARLARRHLGMRVFGRVDGLAVVNAVAIARRGLRCVQASL
jgi:hypothetical protein